MWTRLGALELRVLVEFDGFSFSGRALTEGKKDQLAVIDCISVGHLVLRMASPMLSWRHVLQDSLFRVR